MSYHIRIESVPYEDPYHMQWIWAVSNGSITASFDYYDAPESLVEIAERLEQFPLHNEGCVPLRNWF